MLTFTNPTDLILEIPKTTPQQVSLQGQTFSNSYSQYQGYINELCLSAVLQWLQEDVTPQAKVWPTITVLSSFWELVTGTALTVDTTRLILIPNDNIDLSEFRVPQEWVDIPGWVGDYYLAVQVEPEDGYVKIWGYCTHAALKENGTYDASDRTYSLDASDMIADINVLTLTLELCPTATTRAVISPLPSLPQTQAENLITRLANPEIITPRLAIPFTLWAGLIAHGGWRQKLSQQRLGLPEQWSVLQWLQRGVSQVAETAGWGKLNLEFGAAGARSVIENQPQQSISRQLAIAGQLYELSIIPQRETWRFELRHLTVGVNIPGGFKLRLLTEDLQPFPNNEAVATTAVESLFIEVALDAGEGIVWEIEPLPDNYDQEILRF
ncbi:hypothetical protein B6N60_02087 [Richelia sinica FACHB-800]|uniref:DUF1822 family protein n=1 Tax=Richelia sinica FACHB-800 TaxID=1357546 RepID=A0A975Y4P9_9NOST|nr:DUF1822 family protein [Richelia sinica]MBD2666622.1 DUF1822 family protein [Richelia sinica FACHB-800]QXE23397.1 hypothetical protein B6N60_02087 [Richelia sinica FACHB-800]